MDTAHISNVTNKAVVVQGRVAVPLPTVPIEEPAISQGITELPPVPQAQTERAIGRAVVDSSILSNGPQPDFTGVNSAMERVQKLQTERASKEAAAQAALQQAGILMSNAAMQQQAAKSAADEARSELQRAHQDVTASLVGLRIERNSMALKSKVDSEFEARAAAKAKAEETATLESIGMVQQELATLEADIARSQARRDSMVKALRTLRLKAQDAQETAATATQHAANLTASSAAHSKEAELVERQMAEHQTRLKALEAGLIGGAVGVGTGIAAEKTITAIATPPVVGTSSSTTNAITGASPHVGIGSGTTASMGVADQWLRMTTFSRGAWRPGSKGADFRYMLRVRISDIDTLGTASTGTVVPDKIILHMRLGAIEACSQPLSTSAAVWDVEAQLPVISATDLLAISLYSIGAGFTDWASFDWDHAQLLGSAFVSVGNLADGHESRNNSIRLDGIGGRLTTWLQMTTCEQDGFGTWQSLGTHRWFLPWVSSPAVSTTTKTTGTGTDLPIGSTRGVAALGSTGTVTDSGAHSIGTGFTADAVRNPIVDTHSF